MTRKKYALCVDNTGYKASLILNKIYEIMPDERASLDELVRVVDESGEDYLFHKRHFVMVDLPEEIERFLVAA